MRLPLPAARITDAVFVLVSKTSPFRFSGLINDEIGVLQIHQNC